MDVHVQVTVETISFLHPPENGVRSWVASEQTNCAYGRKIPLAFDDEAVARVNCDDPDRESVKVGLVFRAVSKSLASTRPVSSPCYWFRIEDQIDLLHYRT